MELEPLNNARWGFASNCFVCEDANDEGLRVRFFCDRDRGAVVADFTLSDAFSGAPRYLHGGVVAAVLVGDAQLARDRERLAQRDGGPGHGLR
jgi:hypothetical protein